MTKFECNSYEYHECGQTPCRVESDECPAKCPVTGRNCDWRKSGSDEPSPLPKLTAAVFDRPDCPEWARFAAVDYNGEGWWYSEEPKLEDMQFTTVGGRSFIAGEFDASRWRNSLIERPAKPKPQKGDWVVSSGHYGIVTLSNFNGIVVDFVDGYDPDDDFEYKPVTWRAWTLEEAPVMLKATIDGKNTILRLSVDKHGGIWYVASDTGKSYTLDAVREYAVQLSGLPCGVPVIGGEER